LLFPNQLLYPLFSKTDSSLITEAQPVFYMLLGILMMSTFGAVLVNTLSGTGATFFGLKVQAMSVLIYLAYIYYVTNMVEQVQLPWVWFAEIVYWSVMIAMAVLYLRSERWHANKF
jgi:Na+-driven multidrug efflux pump